MLVIRDPSNPPRLLARPCRPWDLLAARLLASCLDRRLASGQAPETNRLLATRAQTLVRPDEREASARNWQHLVAMSRCPPAPRIRRVPLCRDRIMAAEPVVRAMVVALVAPLPVPARGVAMANVLLRDGAGPLYNRRSPSDLFTRLRETTRQLDPLASLVPARLS